MQILPSINNTGAAQSALGGSAVLGTGGLFGGEASGLFGSLLSLFGQTQTPTTPTTGTNVNTAALLTTGELLTLTGEGTTARDLPTLLFSFMQHLQGNPTLSPELKAVLGEDTFDITGFQQRLNALPEDQLEAVMAELAALMQPLLVNIPNLPVEPTEGALTSVNLVPTTASPTDKIAEPATKLPQPLFSNLPTPADEAPTEQPSPEVPAAQEPAKKTASVQPLEKNLQIALDGLTPVATPTQTKPERKTSTTPGSDTTTAPLTMTATAPASAAKPTSSPQTTTAVVAASGISPDGKVIERSEPGASAQTLQLEAAPQHEAGKTKFTDHLEQIKLNRTGAHTPVTEQIAVHLSKATQNGQDKMTIRLQPPELGRIDIKLDITADGMIKASIQVDQPATLDLMLRDQKGLEKALAEAGLKTDNASLNFNLRGDSLPQRQNGGEQQANQGGQETSAFNLEGESEAANIAGVMEMTWYVGPDRVDVRI